MNVLQKINTSENLYYTQVVRSPKSRVEYFFNATFLELDYYAFGAILPGRNFSSAEYKFGFNGKENDNEIKGAGNQQDYGMRIYNPGLGKFLSVDPLSYLYPWYSPYIFAGNKPIWATDLDGLEENYVTLTPNMGTRINLHRSHEKLVSLFVGATIQAVFGHIAGELGVRGDIGKGTMRMGSAGNFVSGSLTAFAGLAAGSFSDNSMTGFSAENNFEFAGSGINSGGAFNVAIGYGYTYVMSSKLNGVNINQALGIPYGRFTAGNQSWLASHANDLFSGSSKDENFTAYGTFAYNQFNFSSADYIQAKFAFVVFTPSALYEDGRRVWVEMPNGSHQYIVDGNSHGVWHQQQTGSSRGYNPYLNFSNATFDRWIQQFWQNDLAHGKGFIHATYNRDAPTSEKNEKVEKRQTRPKFGG